MAKKNMDEVKQLIDIGKEKGFLTFDEVNDILPPDIATEQIDDVMGMFGDMDIEIVDSSQKVKIPKIKIDLDEGEEEAEGEESDAGSPILCSCIPVEPLKVTPPMVVEVIAAVDENDWGC